MSDTAMPLNNGGAARMSAQKTSDMYDRFPVLN